MSAQQVQILKASDHGFEFNLSGLESMLLADNVKDLPVVVVSVADAYRQGKSFLLNFLLKYLRNNGRHDWLADINIPLQGFEWRPGSTRNTVGILLWNEVFVMTKPGGEKVAVLLMDTQGTFDTETTLKDNTTIFSMSMLTSSVQVYNLMNNIKEDDLQHLQFFAEYGRLAQKEAAKTFQRLLFLVRDWNYPDEYKYGAEGGRAVIESRLKIKDGQPKELTELRKKIRSCFSEIDGFLMPHPGDKVARDSNFDGRLEHISEEFRAKLQELIPFILAPENLLVKEINGKKITCEVLMTLFKAYADKFQGNNLPEPASMLQATVVATNVNAVDKSRRFYMNEIKKMPQRDLSKLLTFHQDLMTRMKDVFRNCPRMGGDEVSSDYLENLTKELQAHFHGLFEEEERLIKKEQEQEAERQKEREEERKREEQRERERQEERRRAEQREREIKLEKEKAAAAERERKKAMDALKAKEEEEEARKKAARNVRNKIAQGFKAAAMAITAPFAAVLAPVTLPLVVNEFADSVSNLAE